MMKIGVTSLSNYVVASKNLLKLKINYIHDPRISDRFGEIDIENFSKSLKFLQKADDTSVSFDYLIIPIFLHITHLELLVKMIYDLTMKI